MGWARSQANISDEVRPFAFAEIDAHEDSQAVADNLARQAKSGILEAAGAPILS